MSDFEKGMLVQHASLGLGKVVALEPKAVHVFFVGRDSRFAAKLRLPDAVSLLKPAAPGDRVWLGGVSAFSLDAASGRYGFAETWIPHEEAVARFMEAYPKGFANPLYTGDGKGRQARPARIGAPTPPSSRRSATARGSASWPRATSRSSSRARWPSRSWRAPTRPARTRRRWPEA